MTATGGLLLMAIINLLFPVPFNRRSSKARDLIQKEKGRTLLSQSCE
jgi:hypothetical protein